MLYWSMLCAVVQGEVSLTIPTLPFLYQSERNQEWQGVKKKKVSKMMIFNFD